jgi:hypothetical protein
VGHALEVDGARLEVDPHVGGRVTSLRVRGVEVLSGPAVDRDNYGSTFWTSPQSDWGWPPPAEIDRAPYSIDVAPDRLTLTGTVHHALGVKITKRFSADRARRAFALEYAIANVSATAKTYAPWEVTRVLPGGLTFFPARRPASGTLHLEERGGVTWFAHDPASLPPPGQKAFSGGKGGWLAHAVAGLLYVKRFAEVPRELLAPGEAEIEIYANSRYVELEVQGRYARIEPGASASWAVTWYLRGLPDSVEVAPGNAGLLALADRLVR